MQRIRPPGATETNKETTCGLRKLQTTNGWRLVVYSGMHYVPALFSCYIPCALFSGHRQ